MACTLLSLRFILSPFPELPHVRACWLHTVTSLQRLLALLRKSNPMQRLIKRSSVCLCRVELLSSTGVVSAQACPEHDCKAQQRV